MCGPKAQASAPEPATIVDVVFRLERGMTRWGETIHVVGDCAELGSWTPEKGVLMATDEESYPKWRSNEVRFCVRKISPELDGTDGDGTGTSLHIRYKYVCNRYTLGEGYAWEESIEDRTVSIPVMAGSRSAWIIKDAAFDAPGETVLVETTPLKVPTPPVMRSVAPENTPEQLDGCSPVFSDAYVLVGDGPLAKGGFSSVWRCRPLVGGGSEDSDRAVKCIDKEGIPDRGKRFLYGHGSYAGEIQLHSRLDHPNIVKLHEVFDDASVTSLVMQYCRGGDLLEITLRHHQRFDRGLQEVGAAAVARQLFSAVAFLHEQGIIHRDIKAENVCQLEDRDAPPERATFQLCDFGLAARIQPDEVLLEQVGSPSTSAPEVVHGRPYGKPADIWSAGATIYTAIAARRPFEAASYAQMLKNAKGQVVLCGGIWENISGRSRDFLGSILQAQAVHRPCVSTVLEHPWLQQ